MNPPKDLSFCDGVDASEALPKLDPLLKTGWEITSEKNGLTKRFYFNTYTKVMDFANCIAIRSKRANHHSTLVLKSGSAEITWTTHVPPGLSMKDIKMAGYCDEVAKTTVIAVDESESLKCGARSKA